ncbi:MAG: hypothetical protein A4E53_03578 [Pelotomaculum sp. PtaB.Bin104]|nr:MAG: hypothetical protein A4E53_03578 [Pelotomaculum sp. PtaB.Bin104]
MWLRWMFRFADGVVVSTKNIAERLKLLNKNIEVVPNALDERLFEQSRNIHKLNNNNHLVFGYMGTLTHIEDLISIVGPLRRVLAQYKKFITFEIVGIGDNNIIENAFHGLPIRIKQVPPQMVLYDKFTNWMQQNIHWDFGIAPLIDSEFTRSKSDIKFLDYAVQGIPGIFSAVPAYNDTIKHMENGLLAATSVEWEYCLRLFVTDRDLRLRLGQRAHTEVWQHRMLANSVQNWIIALRSIYDKTTESHGDL